MLSTSNNNVDDASLQLLQPLRTLDYDNGNNNANPQFISQNQLND